MSFDLLNHVDGRERAPRSGRFLDDLEPATGRLLARVPRSDAGDVDDAVAAAKAAYGTWSRTTVAERADLCEAIADAIRAHRERLAEAESRDTGKPIQLALTLDIPRAEANFRFFAGAVRHARGEAFPMDGAINLTHRHPLGVVGLITPWNLPLYLLTWKAAPALAMGNTVVAKPSELTPWTASLLAGLFAEIGAPPGIFNVVHGLGPEVGEPLCVHPDVKAISFTGGTVTGARVAETVAPRFKKLSLELGGKNATLVFADCDLEAALDGAARAAFLNQGQICLCGSRILVERPIFERFVEGLVTRAERLVVGDPLHPGTGCGALVSEAHRAKVEGYLALAREEGGTVRCGGDRPTLPAPWDAGAFLRPTVITGLAPTCRTATEEIFGPVVTVHPFDTEDEAIAIANGTRYGLAASVWTRDLDRAHRVPRRLECGMVWVNTWLLRDLRVPFGGERDSGVGREGGDRSLAFFSEDRNICLRLDA